MQETPNFQNYKNQFLQYTVESLVDNPTINEPYRTVIIDAHTKLNQYFTDDQFRQTLSTTRRNNIESQIGNILPQFAQIVSFKSNPAQLQGSIEGISNNIQAYVEDLDLRFSYPYQTYLLQNTGNIAEILERVRSQQSEVETSAKEAKKTVENAQLVVARGSAQDIANHFQMLANGREAETDKAKNNEESLRIWPYVAIGVGGVICVLAFDKLIQLGRVILTYRIESIIIATGLILLLIAIFGNKGVQAFKERYPGGYERSAVLWLFGAIASVIFTAVFAFVLMWEMGNVKEWEAIIPKIIGLLAPAYMIRFCVQNYRSNMHLMVINSHKALIARDASAFSGFIPDRVQAFQRESLLAKSDIVCKASAVLFTPGETGYITTKEGAGNGNDTVFDGVPFMDKVQIK